MYGVALVFIMFDEGVLVIVYEWLNIVEWTEV